MRSRGLSLAGLILLIAGVLCGIAIARTITIDGYMDDWINEDIFYAESEITPGGAPPGSHQTNIFIANDARYLYVAYQLEGPSVIWSNWTHNMYLDTDMDIDTGFRGMPVWMTNGYDHLVQYGGYRCGPGCSGAVYSVFVYTGTVDQTSWHWRFIREIDYSYNEKVVEFRVELSDLDIELGDQAVLEFQATGGDVTNYGEETWAELLEKHAKTNTFLGPTGTITVDGDLSDWSENDLFYNDWEITDGTPNNSTYSNIYVTDTPRDLYIGLLTKDAGGGPITNTYLRGLFIDIDMDINTGYRGWELWMTGGGYDRYVEYGGLSDTYVIYDFTGSSQSEWSWGNATPITYGYGENTIEWQISRGRLGVGNRVRLEFEAYGDGVVVTSWAHQAESSVKTYYFSSEANIPTLTEWGMIILATILFLCGARALRTETVKVG